MKKFSTLRRDESGAVAIETAFALPALIIMVWAVVQLGLVFRAMSGIQHALGEGARLATLYPQPTDDAIRDRIEDVVYGIGPGTFTIEEPVPGTENGSAYLDLEVSYTQQTDMLFLPGPTITVSRSKRVWVAED
ncbi:MAG TPA: TadE/TadG family type IV pilus assembly protein [Sphingomicrobium sp.]|jgi:Flp pilus assembly protein TadG|nr:TadE/TadG family type IV pilus assembly protein [Sphingomicrobium sp.]